MNLLDKISKVITGGQTGADMGGLRAAKHAGLKTGGWAAKGWDTEHGPNLNLKAFGLVECPQPGFRERTIANVADASAVIWFGTTDSPGGRLTTGTAVKFNKPLFLILGGTKPAKVAEWLANVITEAGDGPFVLMVAGNRASIIQGIEEMTFGMLVNIFNHLKGVNEIPPDSADQSTESVPDRAFGDGANGPGND